jgi:peptidyl-prolyl cis-trans isomerase SurA
LRQELDLRRSHIPTSLAVAAGLALFSLMGCHRQPSPEVMATVNGKEILRADLEKYYQASLGDNPQQPTTEQAEIVHLNILRQMIEDEILQERAAKLNLAATDEDVNAKLTEMKAPFTQEEFDRQLRQRNLTLDDLKRDIRRSVTNDKLLNKEIYSKINITDADISSYYNAHKAEFNFIEPQYHLAEIAVTTTPPQQPGTMPAKPNEAEARKRIQALLNRLQSGEDFGAVAMTSSDYASNASNGGDMGFVGETALHSDPTAYDAISNLKQGQMTGIIPIYDGTGPGRHVVAFTIFKLISKEPAGQRAMSDPRVQQAIRQQLRDAHAQLLKNAYFEVLHDQATVRNYFAEQILKSGGQ